MEQISGSKLFFSVRGKAYSASLIELSQWTGSASQPMSIKLKYNNPFHSMNFQLFSFKRLEASLTIFCRVITYPSGLFPVSL